MAAITICTDLGAPPKWSLSLFPLFPHLFAMKWRDRMPRSLFFECWVLSQLFPFPLSLSSRGIPPLSLHIPMNKHICTRLPKSSHEGSLSQVNKIQRFVLVCIPLLLHLFYTEANISRNVIKGVDFTNNPPSLIFRCAMFSCWRMLWNSVRVSEMGTMQGSLSSWNLVGSS